MPPLTLAGLIGGAPSLAQPASEEEELARQIAEIEAKLGQGTTTPEVTKRERIVAGIADALSRLGAGVAQNPSLQTNFLQDLVARSRQRISEQREAERTSLAAKHESLSTRRKEAREERLGGVGFERQKELMRVEDELVGVRSEGEFTRNNAEWTRRFGLEQEAARAQEAMDLERIRAERGDKAAESLLEKRGQASSLAWSMVHDFVYGGDGRPTLRERIVDKKEPIGEIINEFQLLLRSLTGQGLLESDRLVAISELNGQIMRIVREGSRRASIPQAPAPVEKPMGKALVDWAAMTPSRGR